ncbi:hypothetical protein TEA_013241 [Camellia sinensis var. sinensis]|uniref:Uncharacterized protein n=1 Tax=Camellia sinensis var. sinensis TaxID=542762 RepID=A0A4S4CY10_CAMSN|nr:hypothetical protein TEA_013241 [Camellia sinensis var. sinensis]
MLKVMEMTCNLHCLSGLGSELCQMCLLVGITLVAVIKQWPCTRKGSLSRCLLKLELLPKLLLRGFLLSG